VGFGMPTISTLEAREQPRSWNDNQLVSVQVSVKDHRLSVDRRSAESVFERCIIRLLSVFLNDVAYSPVL
jgi:hypothetical protein